MRRRGFLSVMLLGAGITLTAGVVCGVSVPQGEAHGPHHVLRTHVAGSPYRIGFETPVDSVFHTGQQLRAVRKPMNSHGLYAIALYQGDWHVGYVPRVMSRGPQAVLATGRRIVVEVIDVDPEDPWEGVSVELRWTG